MRVSFWSLMVVACVTLGVASEAGAQDSRQRAAAAEAYDRGTSGYMTGDYAEAAQWFETAHRMAPAPAALMQAIRAHQKAENLARAATLALMLQQEYPGEGQAVQYAEQILAEAAPTLFRVDVECSGCEIDLDEAVQQGRAFFVEADTTHSIVAHFSTGDVSREVSGAAGESTTLEISAPAAQVDPSVDPSGEPSGQQAGQSEGLPPVVTFVAAGVTVALAIGTIISAVDMYAGASEYEKAANQAESSGNIDDWNKANKLLADKRGQTRTNVLIGATLVSAVATGVIAAVLTDWSSEEEADTHAAIVPTPHGVMGFVESRF